MGQSTQSSSSDPKGDGSNPDPIAAQLAAIASCIESLESLKMDAAALKARAVSQGNEDRNSSWDELVHALQKTFGPAEFHNPDQYLCSIKQTGTVQEYRQEFAKRSARVSNWPDNCLLGVFLNALKEEIKTDVRIHKPRSAYNALSLALEYESKLSHTRSGKNQTLNPTPKPHLPEMKNLPSTPSQSTTQPKQPLHTADTKKDVKHVKKKPANASKGYSKPAVGPSATGPVTEEEVKAVLLHQAPVTTKDLVAKFKSRLRTKQAKSAFTEILTRICMIQKKTNGPNYAALRDK